MTCTTTKTRHQFFTSVLLSRLWNNHRKEEVKIRERKIRQKTSTEKITIKRKKDKREGRYKKNISERINCSLTIS